MLKIFFLHNLKQKKAKKQNEKCHLTPTYPTEKVQSNHSKLLIFNTL